MHVQHATEAAMISVEQLEIPEAYTTASKKVEDEFLQNSIKLTGIQQPLIVTRLNNDSYIVIDGVRRLRIAGSLGMSEVPCVIDYIPDDADDQLEYRNRIRFILDEHRQDLLPSQRAKLIKQFQNMFDFNAKQVAVYFGVTPATITNWTLVDKVIPEVQKAIDNGEVSVHAARAFPGMTQLGQEKIWQEHKEDMKKLKGKFHRWVRENYPPNDCREMYKNPESQTKQLDREKQKRKGRKRVTVTLSEKKALLRDVDLKKAELDDKKAKITDFEKHIEAAIPVITAIRESPDVWESLSSSVRKDFEEFAERFIA